METASHFLGQKCALNKGNGTDVSADADFMFCKCHLIFSHQLIDSSQVVQSHLSKNNSFQIVKAIICSGLITDLGVM